MATLNIKNLPEPIARKLKKRAERSHRSVTQEVIYLLERATAEIPPSSIMELRGLGKSAWEDTGAVDHVSTERDTWG